MKGTGPCEVIRNQHKEIRRLVPFFTGMGLSLQLKILGNNRRSTRYECNEPQKFEYYLFFLVWGPQSIASQRFPPIRQILSPTSILSQTCHS